MSDVGAPATDDPLALAAHDYARARAASDPLADVCYLATVAHPRRPEVRALALRAVSPRGVGVLITRLSPKWTQIEETGAVGVLLHWPSIGAQYRLSGRVEAMEPDLVAQHWNQKRHGSRLIEHYYRAYHAQSAPIPSHDYFRQGIEQLRQRHPIPDTMPMPEDLAGIYVVPDEVEVWHAAPDRLHVRRRFRREPGRWVVQHLVP